MTTSRRLPSRVLAAFGPPALSREAAHDPNAARTGRSGSPIRHAIAGLGVTALAGRLVASSPACCLEREGGSSSWWTWVWSTH